MDKPNASHANAIILIVFCCSVAGCANPQRDAYEQALAAVEREEQRLLAQANDSDSELSIHSSAASSVGGTTSATIENHSQGSSEPGVIAPISTQLDTAASRSDSKLAWRIISSENPSTGTGQCLVVSRPLEMSDDGNKTRIQLVLTDKAVYLRADRPLNSTANQISLRIDSNLPVMFEAQISTHVVALSANYTAILNQLLTGSFITVSTVFVSESGVPNLQLSEFGLDGFIQAYARVDTC